MTTIGWWMLVAAALIFGAVLGGWSTLRIARIRHAARLRKATDDLQHRFATTIDQLRVAQVRAQTELEQTRNAFKKQLAAAADEPRAAAARAEERLRAAYEELDRMRRASQSLKSDDPDLSDGFAATRPMYDGL